MRRPDAQVIRPGRSDLVVRRHLPRIAQLTFGAVAAAVCLTGYLLPMHGTRLGAPSPPFYGFFEPLLTRWTPVSVLGLTALAVLGARLLSLDSRRFAAFSVPLALASRTVANVARHGPDELIRPLTGRLGENDALSSLHLFTEDPARFLGGFAARVRDLGLPVHVMGHPPGSTVLLGGMSAVGLGGAWAATAMILTVGALAAPLVYLLAAELVDEPAARLATLAWIFAPSVLLESATSLDAVYATAGVGTALLFLRSRRSTATAAAVGCSFLSYALLGAITWAVLILIVRGSRRRAVELVLLTVLAAVCMYGVLWLATGYDPLAAFRATSFAYDHGVSQRRPDWYWAPGDLTAFLVALGPLVALAFAHAFGERSQLAAATMAVLVIAALGGFAKAEVERIWLFAVPLVAIAAAPRLRALEPWLLLLPLAAQALIVEVAFGTTW